MTIPQVSRRALLAAAAGTAAAATLGGCGGDDGSGTSGGGGAALPVKLSDVPVGGAVSAETPDGDPIIVAQPKAGTAVAFSAICTHMGCTVAPDGAQLKCPCHGSVYEAATGDNVSGPAPKPLPPFPVKVTGGEVVPA